MRIGRLGVGRVGRRSIYISWDGRILTLSLRPARTMRPWIWDRTVYKTRVRGVMLPLVGLLLVTDAEEAG